MVERTIDQALRKGVEAHKAGQLQVAEGMYKAILKVQPNHPDANHNMAVLAVSIGKVEQALPFFRNALEANPKIAQFWLSYIDAFIRLDRLTDAKAVFNQAKSKGAKGDSFNELEQKLNLRNWVSGNLLADRQKTGRDEPNILDALTLDQAIRLATKKTKAGAPEEARGIYRDIFSRFPKNKRARDGLKDLAGKTVSQAPEVKDPPTEQIQALVDLYHKGQLKQALEQTTASLQQFPDSSALYNLSGALFKGLGQLDASVRAYAKALAINPDYAHAHNNMGVTLQEQGKLEEAIEAYKDALAVNPNYSGAYNNMGNALKKIGRLEEAITAYNKALTFKPDNAEAYNNKGNTLKELEKLEEAIEAYKKALAINPDYAEAYSNMGNLFQEQGKLNESIEVYNKALAIKPDYAEAYNNMGNTLKEQDRLDEALEAYNQALAIKPDDAETYNNMGATLEEQGKLKEAIKAYNQALTLRLNYADAIENSLSLYIQLLPLVTKHGYDFDSDHTQATSEVVIRPKYQVQHLIKTFLTENFSVAQSYNNYFKACDPKLLGKLHPKDKVFCEAYSTFIAKLLDTHWDEVPVFKNKVYHLGESHCLSYAHRNIIIDGSDYKISPRIIFGAKAFHFSRTKHDSFKAITKAHFVSLPKSSKIFLSFGEIDCRPKEGFISAARKLDKPLEELIDQTAKGYVKWFSDHNADQRHHLYFINVPAPVYNNEHGNDLNSAVARTVTLFNNALEKYSLQHGFHILDVFRFTAGNNGFSNGLFHVDNNHLGAKALLNIAKQLI